jgi:hypothetical protein
MNFSRGAGWYFLAEQVARPKGLRASAVKLINSILII